MGSLRCERSTAPQRSVTSRITATSSGSSACTGCPPAALSTRVPMSRRRARQRCTRQSETCHNEHAQRWANPAATASSTLFRTASLTSAGTRAGTGPLSPNRIFPARPPARWPAP